MKSKIIVILFFITSISLVLSSYQNGPANHGWDCTGAESDFNNPTGCTTGSCHGSAATPGITVVLQLDSAGIPVTGYHPGMTYTVRLTGTNTTGSSLPRFGFQIAAITGSTMQSSPATAGTWGTPEANTHVAAPSSGNYVINIVEHTSPLAPTTGTGSTGSTYTDTISWTAPAAGTGVVSLWAALNAVNGNGQADQGDLWNVAHIVITEDTVNTHTGISALEQDRINIWPNPVSDRLHIQVSGAGSCDISVCDISGALVLSQKTDINTLSTGISTAGWTPGVYLVSVRTDISQEVFRVLKQ